MTRDTRETSLRPLYRVGALDLGPLPLPFSVLLSLLLLLKQESEDLKVTPQETFEFDFGLSHLLRCGSSQHCAFSMSTS